MPQFDLPLEALQTYQSPESAPDDFDAFWRETLAAAAATDWPAEFTPVADPLYTTVDVQDVTFAGYAGDPIRAWLITPTNASGPLPCLVEFVGYGGGRSEPHVHLAPATAGFAHFVMDTRGQGAGWSAGSTGDPHPAGGPAGPGMLTRGIEDRESYYFRRLYTDAARAVRVAADHESIDETRIGVCGASQGGGLALVAASLASDLVRVAISDVPFLCNFARALQITDAEPYRELARYLACQRDAERRVRQTLAYFDCLHFAPRITAPCLMSAGLCDLVCPPSTIFSVYNRLAGEREMRVYPFNAHEGGGVIQRSAGLRFARRHLVGTR